MSSQPLPTQTIANLETLEGLDRSLDNKYTFDPGDGLYPRDGTEEARIIEEKLSHVTIPDQRLIVSWSSGMSAVRETVNFAAIRKAGEDPRGGSKPKIAFSQDLYSQSTAYFEREKQKGVDVTRFDSSEPDQLSEIIAGGRADVVFAETVANTPNMPVLDVEQLLGQVREMDRPPILVLDNTLPLSTGLSFDELLKPDDQVVVVESGTKNLMNNSDILGITYSKNSALIEALRMHKAHSGAVNSLGGLATIATKLDITIPGFAQRNMDVFASTNALAQSLTEAREELGGQADFETVFPMNPSHPNFAVAKKLADRLGVFPTPVSFITASKWSETATTDLMSRIANHPAMREQIAEGQIHLGQSFGTPKARLLYDRNAPNVRFSGGYAIDDVEALAKAVKEALADK